MGAATLLPYPMRLGSGTYDFNLGLTWNQYNESYSLGAQVMSTLRTGENNQDYRLGHENKLNFGAQNLWTIHGAYLPESKPRTDKASKAVTPAYWWHRL